MRRGLLVLSGEPAAAVRSNVVTVTAWTLIASFGMLLLLAVFQNLALVIGGIGDARIDALIQKWSRDGEPPPGAMVFVLRNAQAILLGWLVVNGALLAASIGLLARKHWARYAIVGFLVFLLVACIAIVVGTIALWVFMTLSAGTTSLALYLGNYIVLVNLHIVIGIGAAAGWVAYRLDSAEVAREFED